MPIPMISIPVNAAYFFAALAIMFWAGYWRGSAMARVPGGPGRPRRRNAQS